MAHSARLYLSAVILLLVIFCAVRSARAAEPPSDLCSLLPAGDVSKTLGKTYDAAERSEAPRPYANTNTGTDCHYHAKNSTFWFRAYVDPSPAASKELFARLSMFYGQSTPVTGLGDEAYFDAQHAIHVRKGKVRYYLNLDPLGTPAATEKQLKDLATEVAGKL